jgi:uncharacterized protein (TIGR02271 family)
MSQKLVGFYEDANTARRVKDELDNAGFDDVSIFSGREGPGLWQEIKEFFGFADEEDRQVYAEAARRGDTAVAVSLDDADAARESRAIEIMKRYNPIDLNRAAEQWRAQGWKGYSGSTSTGSTATTRAAGAGQQVMPVIEEQVQVGKRQVLTGGLRLHTRVTEKPVAAQVHLREEHVTVERRPANRPVTAGDDAFRERQVEVTETAEQPVVSKQARVVEEVVVGKSAQQRTQTVRDTVKRTDVDVEKITPDRGEFVDQFAAEVARDDRYRGREWTSLEPEVRRSFEQRYPGSKWDQFKDAIHRGYDKVRQKV